MSLLLLPWLSTSPKRQRGYPLLLFAVATASACRRMLQSLFRTDPYLASLPKRPNATNYHPLYRTRRQQQQQ
jgi:hypothetical protein